MGLISFTQINDGTTSQASQVNNPLNTIYDEFNGNISAANLANNAVTAPKLADGSVTPAKTAIYNYQTDNSNTIASTDNGAIKIQAGWSQAVGNNTTNFTIPVTFPQAFTTVLGVVVSLNAVKPATAATSITDLNGNYHTSAESFGVSAGSVLNSGFTAYLQRSGPGMFFNTTYYGFSWIAWGIV